jgi:hypothetical protein
MKNRKWLTYTLGTLLTLIALTVVGMAGFRAGVTQSADYSRIGIGERPSFNQNGNDNFDAPPQSNGLNPRGFNRGMPMMGGLFGLTHIVILAVALWFGYKLFQKSGWRLVRVQNETPVVNEPIKAEVEEKKESE